MLTVHVQAVNLDKSFARNEHKKETKIPRNHVLISAIFKLSDIFRSEFATPPFAEVQEV